MSVVAVLLVLAWVVLFVVVPMQGRRLKGRADRVIEAVDANTDVRQVRLLEGVDPDELAKLRALRGEKAPVKALPVPPSVDGTGDVG